MEASVGFVDRHAGARPAISTNFIQSCMADLVIQLLDLRLNWIFRILRTYLILNERRQFLPHKTGTG
jgi:hypothetical protein